MEQTLLVAQFWYEISKRVKDYTDKHLLQFGKHPNDLTREDRPIYLWRIPKNHSVLLAYSIYQSGSAQHDLPKITTQDLHRGSAKPNGKFEALAWRSSIPPYYSYLMRCEIHAPPLHMLPKKKRSQQRRRVSLI